MTITKDKVATIHYTLKDDQGTLIESSVGKEPLLYLHGTGNLITGLENALEGRKKGETVKVTVAPAEGYGDRDNELVEEVAKDEFESDEELEIGKEFQYDDEEGNVYHVRITAIGEQTITVDGNHPLAGKTLNFEVEIIDIRDATKEEKEHGHIHGEGGHHH